MKFSVEIISDHSNLCAAQVEHCIGALCNAVGARYEDAADVHEEDSYGHEWKGTYGSVYYETDEHRFHLVQVDFECDAVVTEKIMIIEYFMCSRGCVATYYDCDGNEIDR